MGIPTPPPELASPEYRQMLEQCIHCGLCLQACPTYSVAGVEMDSPRGRISLMRAASFGRIQLEGAFEEHIRECLACRSCETACPSGVRYGALVEVARNSLENSRQPGPLERLVRWLVLRQLLPRTDRLKRFAWLGRLYQASRLSRLVRSVDILPERLKLMEGMLPELPRRYPDYRAPARAEDAPKGAVGFFHGCVQEAFLADINAATLRVLQRNGFTVYTPRDQTCCGAAHVHLGEIELARQLARRNIDAFLKLEADYGPLEAIINNAGGCGASLKEYPHLLEQDPVYAQKAGYFASKVKDISEFLASHLSVPPGEIMPRRVTYSDSCHLRHAQKVVKPPRDLLRMIPGIELVELSHPDQCCGSAGVYNVLQTETANTILDAKMAEVVDTGAETVVVTNTGCYLQLLYGARRHHHPLKVVHLVELLDESYRNQRPDSAPGR